MIKKKGELYAQVVRAFYIYIGKFRLITHTHLSLWYTLYSNLKMKSSHQRSTSLWSKPDESLTQIQDQLNKLKTRPLSLHGYLAGLPELYICAQELICSPHTQQAHTRILVEDALDVSIRFLDSCDHLKDLLTLMKENIHSLQSAFRRRGGVSVVESHILDYFCIRKKAKKINSKNLGSLKKMESQIGSSQLDPHGCMVFEVLREVVTITMSVFSELSVCLLTKIKPDKGFLSFSKLALNNRTNRDFINEVEMVDVALRSVEKDIRSNKRKGSNEQVAMERLQDLDTSIEALEAELDCLFRILIQSRGYLLNILAH